VLARAQCDSEARRCVLNQILHTPPSLSTGLLNFSRRKLLGAFLALNSPAQLVAIDEFAVGLDESSLKTMRAMISYCVHGLGKCVVISAFDTHPLGPLHVDQIIDLEAEG
jgi:ABC-type Mn2+/Zn2+ transport system ATPase subunit